MLKRYKNLSKYKIVASDGEIGSVEDFYFDERVWTIRYIVVNTGNWIVKNQVLISPISVDKIDEEKGEIHVYLSKEQVENSPDIDTKKPVSRVKEIEISKYYKQGFYWTGFSTWGVVPIPMQLRDWEGPYPDQKSDSEDVIMSNLRSVEEIIGYDVQTENSELGRIDDISLNEENWQIDFISLKSGNIINNKEIDFSIRWVNDISWDTKKVYLDEAENLQ